MAEQPGAGEQALGLLAALGADGAEADQRPRRRRPRRRHELGAVAGERGRRRLRADEMGEGVGQAELRRGAGAPGAGAEQPDHRTARHVGRHGDAAEGMVGRKVALEERQELGQLFREIVDRGLLPEVATQRIGLDAAAARRPPDAEIDPTGMERMQEAEGLCHLHRAVVRQQHGARADADGRGLGPQPGDQDLRRGAGEARHAMMLGDPVALIAERIGAPRQRDGVAERIGRRQPLGHRRLVEDRELQAPARLTSRRSCRRRARPRSLRGPPA